METAKPKVETAKPKVDAAKPSSQQSSSAEFTSSSNDRWNARNRLSRTPSVQSTRSNQDANPSAQTSSVGSESLFSEPMVIDPRPLPVPMAVDPGPPPVHGISDITTFLAECGLSPVVADDSSNSADIIPSSLPASTPLITGKVMRKQIAETSTPKPPEEISESKILESNPKPTDIPEFNFVDEVFKKFYINVLLPRIRLKKQRKEKINGKYQISITRLDYPVSDIKARKGVGNFI